MAGLVRGQSCSMGSLGTLSVSVNKSGLVQVCLSNAPGWQIHTKQGEWMNLKDGTPPTLVDQNSCSTCFTQVGGSGNTAMCYVEFDVTLNHHLTTAQVAGALNRFANNYNIVGTPGTTGQSVTQPLCRLG
ncbi:uncharacterized protein PFL1_03783 [Pseudozyma flocculosa PF-1]|uniref:Uncharacterized protein n=2 Tax=Pseudozyma flocculosa TaxID=84751 RepID=A0A5C3EYC3_9BASI|nr:uncharacterized protein PFL1_03783 [Pseudozyma flocculosa PF-1]EPQ28480.1 hypothetical protein PFL1_03783 [Pseudozyma flocculosa PF-1]SPO36397.1 uncharacterized protein PSFLO_01868 [Pseudozyma flocculosa]